MFSAIGQPVEKLPALKNKTDPQPLGQFRFAKILRVTAE